MSTLNMLTLPVCDPDTMCLSSWVKMTDQASTGPVSMVATLAPDMVSHTMITLSRELLATRRPSPDIATLNHRRVTNCHYCLRKVSQWRRPLLGLSPC